MSYTLCLNFVALPGHLIMCSVSYPKCHHTFLFWCLLITVTWHITGQWLLTMWHTSLRAVRGNCSGGF